MDPLQDDHASPPITVSYHTSPSPDVWERIQADLCRQLPLKNLCWKPTTRPVKMIPSLPISFQPFNSITSLSSSPLVHLLFVACDDLEAYRTIIKQEIRTWLDSVQSHPAEWLIVHVSTAPKPHHSTAGIFRTRTGVLDKLKTDFNPQKRDRCISLSYMSTMDTIIQASVQDSSITQWTELINRLKESLIIVFDLKINEMEESLKMLISKKTRLGWDFETFFIQKAQLANQFQTMNLLEDSLIQYDELDAAFFQSLSDCPTIWNNKIFGKNSSQYSNLALNIDYSEQYLECVGSGQMSIFDLRIYLLSKQLNLLGRLGRIDEAIKRATSFLATFSAFLRSYQHIWPPNFIESWIYSTSNELVEWCESQVNPTSKDPATLDSLKCCAEILELAHIQLDRIGIQLSYLPSAHPFNMAFSREQQPSPSKPQPSSTMVVSVPSRNRLDSIIKAFDAFEKAYLDLASKTINLYQLTGRRRFALKLHCKIAAFEQIRNRQESAHRLFSHLPAHYVDDKWTTIESSLLDKCAGLQKELGLSREWLLSTLALVRSGVTYEPGKWSQDVMLISPTQFGQVSDITTDRINLATKLMNDIKEQSLKLEKDFAAIGFPIFSISLNSSIGRLSFDNSLFGSMVQVNIKNLLPCSIEVEAVRTKFSGKKYETVWFTAGTCTLLPGETTVDLFSPTPVAETLILEVSQIRISRILFQYHHHHSSLSSQQPNLTSGSNEKYGEQQKPLEVVSFPQDPLGLDVKLDFPYNFHLDQTRICMVNMLSGRNYLNQAIISISSPDLPITFDFAHSNLCDQPSSKTCVVKTISSFNDKIILDGIEANSSVYMSVPFHTSTNEKSAEVNVSVDYRISIDESVKRTFRKTCTLFFSVPIQIQIQKIFRSDCVFVNFAVGTDRFNPIRIHSANLDATATSGSNFEEDEATRSLISITPNWAEKQPSMVILPAQTTDYFFKVTSSEINTPKITGSDFKLIIKYRLLLDEIVEFLKEKLINALIEGDDKEKIPYLLEEVKNVLKRSNSERFEEDFYEHYLDHHMIDPSRLLKLNWNRICGQVEKDDVKLTALVEKIQLVIQDSAIVNRQSDLSWRTISVPFGLSKSTILTTIDYQQEKEGDKVVGRPMRINLLISTCFKWFHRDSSNHISDPPILIYELLSASEDWLIGGHVQGRFLVRENEIEEIKLVLIPLRPGYLQVPEVRIKVRKKDKATRPTQDGSVDCYITKSETGDTTPGKNDDEIHLECNHLNLFHPVLVLPTTSQSSKFFLNLLPNNNHLHQAF